MIGSLHHEGMHAPSFSLPSSRNTCHINCNNNSNSNNNMNNSNNNGMARHACENLEMKIVKDETTTSTTQPETKTQDDKDMGISNKRSQESQEDIAGLLMSLSSAAFSSSSLSLSEHQHPSSSPCVSSSLQTSSTSHSMSTSTSVVPPISSLSSSILSNRTPSLIVGPSTSTSTSTLPYSSMKNNHGFNHTLNQIHGNKTSQSFGPQIQRQHHHFAATPHTTCVCKLVQIQVLSRNVTTPATPAANTFSGPPVPNNIPQVININQQGPIIMHRCDAFTCVFHPPTSSNFNKYMNNNPCFINSLLNKHEAPNGTTLPIVSTMNNVFAPQSAAVNNYGSSQNIFNSLFVSFFFERTCLSDNRTKIYYKNNSSNKSSPQFDRFSVHW
jgi:hypothetical protein